MLLETDSQHLKEVSSIRSRELIDTTEEENPEGEVQRVLSGWLSEPRVRDRPNPFLSERKGYKGDRLLITSMGK